MVEGFTCSCFNQFMYFTSSCQHKEQINVLHDFKVTSSVIVLFVFKLCVLGLREQKIIIDLKTFKKSSEVADLLTVDLSL